MLSILTFLGFLDPAPGLLHAKAKSRELDCERMTAETAVREYPGVIQPPKPRGDYIDRYLVVCQKRLLPGVRAPRDEAILETLEQRTTDLAETTASLRPDLAQATWLVEAFHPSVEVSAKIAFATKNALMRQGLPVSDRTPVLGFGDVDVLTRMPPDEAYPAACRRYAETDSLREGDVLLAVLQRDPRETSLHAGLCTSGRWTWIE